MGILTGSVAIFYLMLTAIRASENIIDSEGFLHTGDVGHIDEEGYVFVVDRVKELIKYKGFQVRIEQLLIFANIS